MTTQVEPATYVRIDDLAWRVDGDEVIIGHVPSGVCIAVPTVAAEVLQLAGSGTPLMEIEQGVGDAVDVRAFFSELEELGFVSFVRTQPTVRRPVTEARWSERLIALWFAPYASAGIVVVVAAAVAVAVTHRSFPTYRAFFWTTSPTLTITVPTVIFLANVGFHELSHLAAARSRGVRARWVGFTRNGHYLVIKTDLSLLWLVPSRDRRRAYLAGIRWDVFAISAIYLSTQVHSFPARVGHALDAGALLIGLSVCAQLFFHTKTDLYYVARDLAGRDDLIASASSLLRARIRELLRGSWLSTTRRERNRALSRYALLYVFGVVAWLLSLAAFGAPILVTFIRRSIATLDVGVDAHHWSAILDAGFALLFQAFFTVPAIYAAAKTIAVRSTRGVRDAT